MDNVGVMRGSDEKEKSFVDTVSALLVCLSICLSVCLYVYLTICLSLVCLLPGVTAVVHVIGS